MPLDLSLSLAVHPGQ